MIRNRLAELLAERGLKISRVALQLPNLSRNTITTTASNKGKMIQLETVDTLCQYLDITPTEFFEYLPYDISCDTTITKNESYATDATRQNIRINNHEIEFDFYIKLISSNSKPVIYSYSGSVFSPTSYTNWGAMIPIALKSDDEDEANFSNIWENNITPGFKPIIWENFKKSIVNAINESMTDRFFPDDFEPLLFQMETHNLELTTDFYSDVPPEDFSDLPF